MSERGGIKPASAAQSASRDTSSAFSDDRITQVRALVEQWREEAKHNEMSGREVGGYLQNTRWVRADTLVNCADELESILSGWRAASAQQATAALAWVAEYYDEVLRPAGCPCDVASGIACPLHAVLRAASAQTETKD